MAYTRNKRKKEIKKVLNLSKLTLFGVWDRTLINIGSTSPTSYNNVNFLLKVLSNINILYNNVTRGNDSNYFPLANPAIILNL